MNHTISSGQNNGIEEPFEQSSQSQITSTLLNENDAVKFEQKLQMMERKEKHVLKKYGFQLIIGCLIGYFIIVILDSILCNVLNWETSSIATSFVELLKFLVSTLIGFVFSESTKSKNN